MERSEECLGFHSPSFHFLCIVSVSHRHHHHHRCVSGFSEIISRITRQFPIHWEVSYCEGGNRFIIGNRMQILFYHSPWNVRKTSTSSSYSCGVLLFYSSETSGGTSWNFGIFSLFAYQPPLDNGSKGQ